jgi:hypothetical protein
MKKPINLKPDPKDTGGGQGPIMPPGTPLQRIHVVLSVVDQGPLHISGLQDLRLRMPPGARPDSARIGIYLGDGMTGEIQFLDKIQLLPVSGGLFAIDTVTAKAANGHLVVGNTIGIEVVGSFGIIGVTAVQAMEKKTKTKKVAAGKKKKKKHGRKAVR